MTYDYICKACGYTWEEEQKIKDDPITECPECKKDSAERQISGGGCFILKGGCWAKEGYS